MSEANEFGLFQKALREHTEEEQDERIALIAAMGRVEETNQLLRKSLFGNGDVGLAERVRALERLAESIRKMKQWFMVGVGGLFLKLTFDMLIWFAELQRRSQ